MQYCDVFYLENQVCPKITLKKETLKKYRDSYKQSQQKNGSKYLLTIQDLEEQDYRCIEDLLMAEIIGIGVFKDQGEVLDVSENEILNVRANLLVNEKQFGKNIQKKLNILDGFKGGSNCGNNYFPRWLKYSIEEGLIRFHGEPEKLELGKKYQIQIYSI